MVNDSMSRTIMQMEIHPELIRLRKERAARFAWMYAGAQNIYGQVSPFREGPMSLVAALLGGLIGGEGAAQQNYTPWRQQ